MPESLLSYYRMECKFCVALRHTIQFYSCPVFLAGC